MRSGGELLLTVCSSKLLIQLIAMIETFGHGDH